MANSFCWEDEDFFYQDAWTSTDGVEWTLVKPEEPCWSPRGMIGGAAVMNGRIWMLGGGRYDTPRVGRLFHNDVWSSADGVHWTEHTKAAPWHPRQYHDVAAWDNKLWVMEGYHVDGGNRNDVWYSADGVEWKELPNTPWKPRHAASLVVYNGVLWMIAGNNMEPDVWRLERRYSPSRSEVRRSEVPFFGTNVVWERSETIARSMDAQVVPEADVIRPTGL